VRAQPGLDADLAHLSFDLCAALVLQLDVVVAGAVVIVVLNEVAQIPAEAEHRSRHAAMPPISIEITGLVQAMEIPESL
jgi:hypothetical protein